ncbi:hypothetical protein VMCG_09825 [Cytospora schulzeri]|uniref:Uncharacterized protein n=1 Tax=Cytospora schulzeri TaxID=448051 RepID=A0A423VHM8_9PEZI|nr:hypothetical protein VMCG_09825 [Valsa malicola]
MAKLFVKVKSVFSRRSKDQEQPPTSDSSSSFSHQDYETEAPSYYHAAAAQPPAYQTSVSQSQPPASRHSGTPSTTFHQQAREIAKIQVGGMRRTVGAGGASSFTASYAPTQPTGPPTSTWKTTTSQTTNPSYGHVGYTSDAGEKDGKSQGNPTGAAYGRQQETTEDDEDMWARLAM